MPDAKTDATYLLDVLQEDMASAQYGEWDVHDPHNWECMIKLVIEIKELIHGL